MKVKELMAYLSVAPPDADVYYIDCGEYGPQIVDAVCSGIVRTNSGNPPVPCDISGCFLAYSEDILSEWNWPKEENKGYDSCL